MLAVQAPDQHCFCSFSDLTGWKPSGYLYTPILLFESYFVSDLPLLWRSCMRILIVQPLLYSVYEKNKHESICSSMRKQSKDNEKKMRVVHGAIASSLFCFFLPRFPHVKTDATRGSSQKLVATRAATSRTRASTTRNATDARRKYRFVLML